MIDFGHNPIEALNAELDDELTLPEKLVLEALAEDKREGDGHFDADGFSNFFPEYGKNNAGREAIEDAWLLYRQLNHLV